MGTILVSHPQDLCNELLWNVESFFRINISKEQQSRVVVKPKGFERCNSRFLGTVCKGLSVSGLTDVEL